MFNSVGAFFSGAGPGHKSGGSVSCSICLEIVTDNGTRSWAKLQCGHEFHLDCIGSAFNAKGAMECPNCRKIEKGQWLYANGSIASISSYPGSSIDEPINDEDNYDSSNSELSPGVLWCPFDQLPHVSSVLEDEEYYSATDHDISGENAVHVEHTAASSSSHPSSYVAYSHPVHPLDNLSGTVSDSSDFSTHWNCPTTVNDMHAFQTMDVNYEGWEHGHPPFLTGRSNVSAADLLSVPAFPPDSAWAVLERSRSFLQPPPASYRAGTSAASSIVPPFPGSNARTQDRVQALQAYYHLQPLNTPSVQNCVISSDERASNHRGLAQVGPIVLPDQADNFFTFPSITDHNFQEADNRQPFYSHSWDLNQLPPFSSNQVNRDPVWGPFYQYPSCPSPAVRFINSFQQRHGSERTS